MKFTDKVYDTLKKAVQVVLPAVATLYFTLSQLWGFPYGEQVLGTIAAITTFLGVILKLSNDQYNRSGAAFDGEFVVTGVDENDPSYSLQLNEDPESLALKDRVTLKVN